MSNETIHLAEESKVAMPLKNLIGMVIVASIAAFTYTQTMNRITVVENNLDLINIEVEENDAWIDSFEPPKEVRETVSSCEAIRNKDGRIRARVRNKLINS